MGFYDCRCMISGVSLKGASAMLVPLQENRGALAPIALGIKGTYNRLGSIGNVEQDANTAAILKFFREREASGEFTVDADYLRAEKLFPVETIERLLQAFERNINDNPQAALLNRLPVMFALISDSLWQAIVQAETLRIATIEAVLGNNPVAAQIYTKGAFAVRDLAAELNGISNFLSSRHIAWKRADSPDQHSGKDMRAYLDQAKHAFRDNDAVLSGLRAYESEVQQSLSGG